MIILEPSYASYIVIANIFVGFVHFIYPTTSLKNYIEYDSMDISDADVGVIDRT